MRLSEPDPAPALYALAIQPDCQDRAAPMRFCRDGGFLGLGWGVASESLDWDTYERRAIERYGAVHAAVQVIHDLPDGALIWTRDPADGGYHLGEVIGPWRYIHGWAAEDCDIHNVRPVRMVAFESPSQVPAAIANRFIGEWVIQRIYNEQAARQSASLVR